MFLPMRTYPVVLAVVIITAAVACGGGGDGNGTEQPTEAVEVELPPPGEYSFQLTGTAVFVVTEEGVARGSVRLQADETVSLQGDLRVELSDDGTFSIPGLNLQGSLGGDVVTITASQGEGSVSAAGTSLSVDADVVVGGSLAHGGIDLSGDESIFSAGGATLSMPPDSAPPRFDIPLLMEDLVLSISPESTSQTAGRNPFRARAAPSTSTMFLGVPR